MGRKSVENNDGKTKLGGEMGYVFWVKWWKTEMWREGGGELEERMRSRENDGEEWYRGK